MNKQRAAAYRRAAEAEVNGYFKGYQHLDFPLRKDFSDLFAHWWEWEWESELNIGILALCLMADIVESGDA